MTSDAPENENAAASVQAAAGAVAAQAAASAEAASHAATEAVTMANVQAAQVAQNASEHIAQTEERLSTWQTTMEARSAETAEGLRALDQRIGQTLQAMGENLSSILKRLEPPQPPPQNQPETNANADVPPAEPKPPEKRRAHRWT